ncbi:MAG TPA: YbaB/EbfC family nucleoid-associated protein [Actinobacteria bacterium]|nr:YbaB/EbfC family nucleoid-associated protein [Actinomycetota bacterium]
MDLGKIMKQAQKVQKEMLKAQEELAGERVEASSGGGMVRVVANGKQEILEVKINPDAVNPEDVELLEDMVLVAVNEALGESRELASRKLSKLTGGVESPGVDVEN